MFNYHITCLFIGIFLMFGVLTWVDLWQFHTAHHFGLWNAKSEFFTGQQARRHKNVCNKLISQCYVILAPSVHHHFLFPSLIHWKSLSLFIHPSGGSTASDTSSPSSLSVSEHASTIKSEPNMAPSPYAGQTVTSVSQVKPPFVYSTPISSNHSFEEFYSKILNYPLR